VRIWLFSKTEVQDFPTFSNQAFSIGLYTPWQNRAEAAVRVFKATLYDLCAQIGTLPELKQVTVRELMSKTAAVRNSMVTWRKTLVELVFRKKAKRHCDYRKLSPEQLSVPVTRLDQKDQTLQKLATKSYLEAPLSNILHLCDKTRN
jgi:hypothetical protein